MSNIVQPSVKEKAFCCPHCSAFTTQYWFRVDSREAGKENPVPLLVSEAMMIGIASDREISPEQKEMWLAEFKKLLTGLVLIKEAGETELGYEVGNLHLSKCFNCGKVAVWVYDRLVFPIIKNGAQPNQDLPEDIVRDFDEAREIVNASPRGAAALLRLCIQKLCKRLGEKGKTIDDDIASLVQKGLNPHVQQSLDIVRVIGNEAVHPGVIDLKDDRDTALRLFDLVNVIADSMISHPKAASELYAKLPEAKRKAIEKRDKK